jgi:WD40 repeat protein
VTASLDDHVKVWRGRELARDLDVKVGTDDGVLAAALSPDGKLLAIGTQDGVVDVWDVAGGTWRARDLARGKNLGSIWRLAYARDGAHVFIACNNGRVLAWDTRTWRDPVELDANEGPAMALVDSPDDKSLAVGYKSGAIVLWDLATGTVKLRIGGRTRERGSCDQVATQKWVDAAHRTIVEAACTNAPEPYFAKLAERTHQRLDGEVDVTWEWAP